MRHVRTASYGDIFPKRRALYLSTKKKKIARLFLQFKEIFSFFRVTQIRYSISRHQLLCVQSNSNFQLEELRG